MWDLVLDIWAVKFVAAGTPEEVAKNPHSLTGQYLSGKKVIPVPKERRKGNGKAIKVTGAVKII